jgi:Mn2+/Fe2+ NRAMP family transporter
VLQGVHLLPARMAVTHHYISMPKHSAKKFVQRLGPGLITGAADDDPSGIATCSQAGSQFRFGLVWTLLVTTPLMIGIQMLSACIGWVTGEGLAANIEVMGEAVKLLLDGSQALYAIAFGALCIGTQVFLSYERALLYKCVAG